MVAITLTYNQTTRDYEWIVTNQSDPYVLKITTPRKNVISVRNFPLINTHDAGENPHVINEYHIRRWYEQIMYEKFRQGALRPVVTQPDVQPPITLPEQVTEQKQMDDQTIVLTQNGEARRSNTEFGPDGLRHIIHSLDTDVKIAISPKPEEKLLSEQIREHDPGEPNNYPCNQSQSTCPAILTQTIEEFQHAIVNQELTATNYPYVEENPDQPIAPILDNIHQQQNEQKETITFDQMIRVCFLNCPLQPLIPFLWVNGNFHLSDHHNSLDLHSTLWRENQTTANLSKVFHPTQNEYIIVTRQSINNALSAIHVDMVNFIHKYDDRQLKTRMMEHQLSRPQFESDMNAIANVVGKI